MVGDAFREFELKGMSIFYPDKVLGWCLHNVVWITLAPLALLLVIGLAFPEHDVLCPETILKTELSCQEMVTLKCAGFTYQDLNCTDLYRDYDSTRTSAIWVVSATIVVLIAGLLFQSTLKRTVKGLTYLAASGRLLPNPTSGNNEWTAFAACFQRRIRSRWRLVLIGTALAIVAVYVYLWVTFPRAEEGGKGWSPVGDPLLDVVGTVLVIMLTPALLVFLAAIMGWVLLVIAAAIRQLTPAYRLDIIPQHPDESGGLAILGDITFSIALPLTVGIILFSAFFLAGFIPLLMLVGLLFLVPGVFVAFLWPLWDVHEVMVEERTRYRDDLAEQISAVETQLRQRLEAYEAGIERAEGDDTLAKLRERLEILNELLPVAKDYPVWPFSKRLALRILSQNSLPPLIVAILQVTTFDSWQDFIDSLIGK